MLTAHDTDAMELEAEAFIEEEFMKWAQGHFGSRMPPAPPPQGVPPVPEVPIPGEVDDAGVAGEGRAGG